MDYDDMEEEALELQQQKFHGLLDADQAPKDPADLGEPVCPLIYPPIPPPSPSLPPPPLSCVCQDEKRDFLKRGSAGVCVCVCVTEREG